MVKPTLKQKSTVPDIIPPRMDDVEELNREEKKKDKEFNVHANTGTEQKKTVKQKKLTPKTKKKKLKIMEKAFNRKDQTTVYIDKQIKKEASKKKWKAIY